MRGVVDDDDFIAGVMQVSSRSGAARENCCQNQN
jgi:hypothetical protein